MGVSDEGLLASMAAGDPDAAAVFVRRYQARVFGLAYTIVGVAAVAEDVAQEVFVKAWRFAGAYDARRGAVATWLLAIARNAAVDAVRASRDRPYDPSVLVDLVMARQSEPDPDPPGDRYEDRERVRAALRELPRDQAVAVVSAACYGLTAREIAERENIPLGTAKTRIRLGLARLRERLEVSDEPR